jgi:hypothetical protein
MDVSLSSLFDDWDISRLTLWYDRRTRKCSGAITFAAAGSEFSVFRAGGTPDVVIEHLAGALEDSSSWRKPRI